VPQATTDAATDTERVKIAPALAPTTRADDAPLSTPVVESEDTFTAAGVVWKASERNVDRVEIRLRTGDTWTPWRNQDIVDGGNGLRGTEPLLLNDAEAAQARMYTDGDSAPKDATLAFVGSDVASEDAPVAKASVAKTSATSSGIGSSVTKPAEAKASVAKSAATKSTVAKAAASGTKPLRTAPASAKPKIIRRATWGANEAQTLDATQNSKLQAIVVHHTAGSNNYSTQAQAAAQVRGDWNYHTNVLKWGDIGYNMLIDKFGNVYEGRRGSIDSLPLGAHAAGFNTNTYGISLLGNYEEVQPSAKMMASLRKVVAWKSYEYKLNPNTKVTLTSRALPGSTSRYAEGTKVSLPTVQGHINTSYTACPGQYVIPKLPALRKNAAADVKKIEAATAKTGLKWSDKNVKDLYFQTKERSPIYSEPTSKAYKFTTTAAKARVTVTHHTSLKTWYKVKSGSTVGYMWTGHFSGTKPFAIANVADYYKQVGSSSTLYAGAGKAWGKASTVPKNGFVTVTHKTTISGWLRVNYNGKTGYIATSSFSKAPGFRLKDIADAKKTLKNTTPVYSGAGSHWTKLNTLRKGQKVTVTHATSRSGWYRINYASGSSTRSGYIWKSHF
jgi:uncharacterized protein YgiM (DUF1202 family)